MFGCSIKKQNDESGSLAFFGQDWFTFYFLPAELHTWNPVVLMQMAVRLAMDVIVVVLVMVVVVKVNNNRLCPTGASNPGCTTYGIGVIDSRTSRADSTSC